LSFTPLLITFAAVQIVVTDPYLAFEYGKAGFPPDNLGYSQPQRFELASSNIHYVRAHLPGDTLSNQTLNAVSVYRPREVAHMLDVQAALTVLRIWQASFILLVLIGLILWQSRERQALATAIQSGGLLASGIIMVIALLAVFGWKFWFDSFHLFFFEPDSWLFAPSDTLIRLFPVEFWFDATLTVAALSLAGGLLLALVGWRWHRSLRRKGT
jgi:integral membrane protein (TIGR01906 family)